MPVLPGAEPYADGDGRIGVVVTHGFTGSPASMKPWGRHLVAAGYRVIVPRLPGHGTRWQDLNLTRWPDWYGEVERTFDRLQADCDQVFAFGLSVGGALSLRLAEVRDDVAGVVVVNPSLATERREARMAKYLAPVVPFANGVINDVRRPGQDEVGYRRMPLKAFVSLQDLWQVTVDGLPDITCPVELYRSRVDHVVEPKSGQLLHEGLAAPFTETVLEDSYHVATLDNDAPVIFDGSVRFIQSVLTGADGGV